MTENGQIAAEIGRLRRELRALTSRERARVAARHRRRKRRPRDLVKVMEVGDVRRSLAAAANVGPMEHALVAVGYHFGLRAGEYGRIRREHVRMDHSGHGEVYVTAEKDSVSRTQPISGEAGEALAAWLRAAPDSPWAFPSARDPQRGIPRGAVNRIVRRVWEDAGLSRRAAYPHILKASIASHLLDSGASVEFVQEWIRHKSVQSTGRYLKLTLASRRRGEDALARLGAALRGSDESADVRVTTPEATHRGPNSPPSGPRRVNRTARRASEEE